ncbi:MAG: DUF1573 domain-containing protein [Bacteroidota bacterium]
MMSLRKIAYSLGFLLVLIFLLSSCDENSSAPKTNIQDTSTVESNNTPQARSTSTTTPADEATVDKKKEMPESEVIEEEIKEKVVVEKEKKENSTEKEKSKKRAKIHFSSKVFDFGFIMEGDTVMHNFYFKNVGTDDLLITKVEPSCGCTVPVYPRTPIAPGEGGKISVLFRSAGKLGRQNPTISVFTNYRRKIKLELKGVVDTERAKPNVPKEKVKVDTTQ